MNMKRLNYFLTYCFAFAMLLECNSVYIINSQFFNQIILLVSFVCLLILLIKGKKIYKLRSLTPFYLLLYVLWALVLYFNGTGDRTFILKFFGILPLLVIYLAYGGLSRFKEILRTVVNIMLSISGVSLFFYLFGTVLNVIPFTETIYSDWAGTYFPTWYNIYFEAQPFRNCGIYPEAPMYNYCLVVALLSEYFLFERNKWKIIVFVAAILTSTSTTGVFALLGLVLIHILSRLYEGSLSPLKTALTLLSIVVIFVIVLYVGNDVFEMKSQTESYADRAVHIKKALKVFNQNIFLGSGYGMNGVGSSNSLFIILADGGIWMTLFFGFALLYWPFLQLLKRNYRFVGMYFIYFCTFSITIVLYTNISLFMLAYPLSSLLKQVKFKRNIYEY